MTNTGHTNNTINVLTIAFIFCQFSDISILWETYKGPTLKISPLLSEPHHVPIYSVINDKKSL